MAWPQLFLGTGPREGSFACCFHQCVHGVLFCLFSQSFLSVPPPAVSCFLCCPVSRGPAVPRPAMLGGGGKAFRGALASGGLWQGLAGGRLSDLEWLGARSAWAGAVESGSEGCSPLPAAQPGLEARSVSVNRENACLPLSRCLPGPVKGC